MKKLFLFLTIIFFSGILLFLYKKSDQTQKPLRLAINPWPGYEFLFLAKSKGFFQEEGLSLELEEFSALEDARIAFERGHVDGMTSTLVEMLQAYSNTNKQSQVVLIPDYSHGADMILAKAPIKSIKDLKNKTVAVEAKSLGIVILSRALEKNQMTLDDVQIKYIASMDMAQAIEKGLVDAAVSYPPMSFDIDKLDQVDVIFTTKEIPEEILDVVSFDQTVLDQNPLLVSIFQKVWKKTLLYAQNNPDESYGMMAHRENISLDDFRSSLEGLKLLSLEEQQKIQDSGKIYQMIEATYSILKRSNDLNFEFNDFKEFIPSQRP